MDRYARKIVDALVLQTYAIKHARGGFGHARIVIALAGVERGALHYETAKAVEIDKIGKFKAIAKCA